MAVSPTRSHLLWTKSPLNLQEAQLLTDDLHLHILMHPAYGKGFMKKCNLSPDAYIQMALQLAYYRLISMRANYEFVVYAKMWHNIVCW